MKGIIFKMFLVLLIICIAFFGVGYLVFDTLDASAYHKVPDDVEILIIGNSQSEHGLNDAIIPHSLNLSQSGDCTFYNYYKGKKIIESNSQVKTVLYLYTNNMFLVGMDEWVYDEKHLGYKFPKYAHVTDLEGQLLLFFKNPGSYLIALRDAIRSNIILLLKNGVEFEVYDELDWGSYKTNDKIADLNAVDNEFNKFYADTSTSELDIHYIDKFDEFCREAGVELILIRVPFHKNFPKIKETDLIQFYEVYLDDRIFYDYLDTIFYDNEFRDIQHLNSVGSAKMSLMLEEQLLKDGIIN